jgi:hypothetical protein
MQQVCGFMTQLDASPFAPATYTTQLAPNERLHNKLASPANFGIAAQ